MHVLIYVYVYDDLVGFTCNQSPTTHQENSEKGSMRRNLHMEYVMFTDKMSSTAF